jgi:hypothetical protein
LTELSPTIEIRNSDPCVETTSLQVERDALRAIADHEKGDGECAVDGKLNDMLPMRIRDA